MIENTKKNKLFFTKTMLKSNLNLLIIREKENEKNMLAGSG